jgi:lipopolysaccharide transport system ATP-binding protein
MSFEHASSASDVSGDVVVRAIGLGKCYHVYERPVHRLLQGLLGDSRKLYSEFWALRNIDLTIRRGETLGIIGRNGSGKSTLLQLIAGTLAPTEGEIEVRGRIAALLELGSGFNPEFTGRENVYLNAALLGLTKAQIDERLDRILAFADIGVFIDQPIRNYSSGMVMRLAFSVMAHVDADVLIIDEALAVGDAFFTQKCMRFLREFKARGTLLFVSHDDSAVNGLCDRAIWLEKGAMQASGAAKDVTHQYLESVIAERQSGPMRQISSAAPQLRRDRHDARREWINGSNLRNDIEVIPFDPATPGFGEMRARITEVSLRDEQGRALAWVVGGERVMLDVEVVAEEDIETPIVGFYLKDRLGQQLFGDNTYLSTLARERRMPAGQAFRARFEFMMPRLRTGDYFFTIGVADGDKEEHSIQHWIHEALAVRSEAEEWATGLIGIPMADIQLEKVG